MIEIVITAHACTQWITRIDPKCKGHREARPAIERVMRDAKWDRDLGHGVVQYRATSRSWPGRVRLRVGVDHLGRMAIVTVLPEHDGWAPGRRQTSSGGTRARLDQAARQAGITVKRDGDAAWSIWRSGAAVAHAASRAEIRQRLEELLSDVNFGR